MMTADSTLLRTFSDEIEAAMAQGHLEEEGIEAFLVKRDPGFSMSSGGPMLILELVVHAKDRERAEAILAAFNC